MTHKKQKKTLASTLPQECFWVNNGPIVSNLAEFHNALKHDISDEQFRHHVTTEKNDFENWIRNTLRDSKCANALKRIKKRTTATRVVGECLKDYKLS